MSVQELNEKVLRGWFEGSMWGNTDHEAAEKYIDDHYALDGKAYGIGGEFVEGPEQFKAFRSALVAAFPTQSFELTHLHAHDDVVWLRYEAKLTTPAGKTHHLVGGGPLEMADGKITKAWNLVNFLDLLEDMEAVPAGTLVAALATCAKSATT